MKQHPIYKNYYIFEEDNVLVKLEPPPDHVPMTKEKFDSLYANYAQIDTQSRVKTAITTTKLAGKNDTTLPFLKSIVTLEKMIPKFVCYSDEKVLVLPKSGRCPSGTSKTSTSQ